MELSRESHEKLDFKYSWMDKIMQCVRSVRYIKNERIETKVKNFKYIDQIQRFLINLNIDILIIFKNFIFKIFIK